MDKYIPPYDLTDEMLDLTAQIMEKIGRLDSVNDLERLPRLRKVSRIKSVHSSLAIENNTLTMQQVTQVLNGKRVLAPEEDVCAVKNAFDAYKEIDNIDPYSVEDLLRFTQDHDERACQRVRQIALNASGRLQSERRGNAHRSAARYGEYSCQPAFCVA